MANDRANRTTQTAPSVAERGHGRHLSVVAIELVKAWPTPMASDAMRGSGTYMRGNLTLTGMARSLGEDFPTPTAVTYGSNQGGAAGRTGKERFSLESHASRGDLPSLPAHETLQAGSDSSPLDPSLCPPSKSTTSESDPAAPQDAPKRRKVLNPVFVESLMGWPPGWTDCEQEATASYLRWLAWHGINSVPRSIERALLRRRFA